MKVLHVSTYDNGGAGRATCRIAEGMKCAGVDSNVLVRQKKENTSEVVEYCDTMAKTVLAKGIGALDTWISYEEIMFERFGLNILHHKLVKEADVIILHWVNHFISYRILEKLKKLKKPIIWVMHDMWLCTGGCHIDRYCGKYKQGCGNCPQIIEQYRKRDKTAEDFLIKKNVMQDEYIYIVTPSSWLLRRANESEILQSCRKRVIHNPIDTEVFKRLRKCDYIKKKYNINSDKKIIAYGAYNALNDSNKGFQYLIEAIKFLPKNKYVLLVYGNNEEDNMNELAIEVIKLGTIKKDIELVEIMNVADVYVAPSEQDNYSNSVLESLACGTPVTAFKIGGMTDLIVHKRNGYLCDYQDCVELAKGIEFCIENRKFLGEYAEDRVRKENSLVLIGEEYKQLCQELKNGG